MKKLTTLLFSLLCAGIVWGQNAPVKKIAMLEPVIVEGKVTAMQKRIIRASLATAISDLDEYESVTRDDIDQLTKELNFQHSGLVNDETRKEIGKLAAADLICIIRLTVEDEDFLVETELIWVENGLGFSADDQLMQVTPTSVLREGCQKLVAKLLE